MADLPDTPPWSPFRRSVARALLGAGGAMVALGACPIVSDARGALLIEQGATLMMAAGLFVIGGASSERAAAWLSARRGLPVIPEPVTVPAYPLQQPVTMPFSATPHGGIGP